MHLQKTWTWLTGLALILSAPFTFAAGTTDQNIISQLQKVREQLNRSAGSTNDCKTPEAANCNFQSYCQQFAGKGKDFYIYQNAEGRQIYNNSLINYMSGAETCLGKSFPQKPVRDPFVYPEQLVDANQAGGADKLRENLARYQKETKRVESIFNDVQDRMVQVLRSRRTKENAKAIDNMLARVTTVKIFTANGSDGIANLSVKGCNIPNAGYDPSDHKITVCPQLMNLPDAALFSILGHELTHSIDPCQMSMSYSRSRHDGIISANEVDFRSPPETPADPFFTAIEAAKNPFNNVISCLEKPGSMNIKVQTQNQLISAIRKEAETAIGLKEEIAEANGNPGSEATDFLREGLRSRVEGVRTYYQDFQYCYNMSGNGHVTESFADWMSSQLLKQKVSDIHDSGKAKTYAAESQMFFMALSCQNLSQAATAAVRPLIQVKCPEQLKLMTDEGKAISDETDTHPDTAKRVSRIMYAPVEIQKALGCQKDAGLVECK